jgi:hypothetical protein
MARRSLTIDYSFKHYHMGSALTRSIERSASQNHLDVHHALSVLILLSVFQKPYSKFSDKDTTYAVITYHYLSYIHQYACIEL